jgi:hypothetical protein
MGEVSSLLETLEKHLGLTAGHSVADRVHKVYIPVDS